jgi:hypothetical protein
VRWIVPFRGRGTSFEPSVIEPGEVDRSLTSDRVETGVRVSPAAADAEVVADNIDACLGGSAGGGGFGASVASIKVIGLSATPISPSGRTE